MYIGEANNMKTHEAMIINDDSNNLIAISLRACAEAKKKNRLPSELKLNPVWHIKSPYGHIVVVELPDGRETEVANPLEAQRRKK